MKLKILEQVALTQLTSIHLGGPARYYYRATTRLNLLECLKWAHQKNILLQILGGGSNTIFADHGFDGLIVQVAITGLDFKRPCDGRVTVQVGAGENWDEFVQTCCERGLAGIECLAGIPGTVGATPIQNVGAYGQEVSQTIQAVECLNRETLTTHTFSAAQCNFAYRQSRFKKIEVDKYCVLSVHFSLRVDGVITSAYPELLQYLSQHKILNPQLNKSNQLLALRAAILALRRKKSMLIETANMHAQSCGSFFMNPILDPKQMAAFQKILKRAQITNAPVYQTDQGTKISAAWLIEQAGFTKGHKHKGVGISPDHALCLVNYNGTTAQLLELRDLIVQAVLAKFEIRLDHEPVILT